MALDLAGERLRELMQGKDVRWLDPPSPYWRIEPPNLLRWLVRGGWMVDDYDDRWVKVIGELIRSFPESYVTYEGSAEEPTGMRGIWKRTETPAPSWKDSESGAYKRALEKRGPIWIVPPDADASEVAHWLRFGAWSMWKPRGSEWGVPRHLAQGAYKTVREDGFVYLVTSSWENQFTEIALNLD